MAELSSFEFETVWNDGDFLLSRSAHRGTSCPVLVLAPAVDQSASSGIARLENAYELRNELDPSWAARPLEFIHLDRKPALRIENPGGQVLACLLGKPWELEGFLRVGMGIAASLGHLHQRGFVHKDIKPANVFVDTATGEAWLSGFGLASRLPRQRQAPEPPELIAGTLAYMAPEQTGRMNRSIDSRSDLYSLGVTFYQMLTGALPFTVSDPIEWVHCHIARRPVPPSERLDNLPVAVSQIVMRLLAKTAEERYQTAASVERDLEHCLADWERQHRIDDFPLGRHDAPDRLLIPEKLYGREHEIDTLLASFERVVASGRPELVLVSGYSGIGKSSVVNELHKVLVLPRGILASGKFDQYKRDIPYATLAQAFQSLVRMLLGRSEAELSEWRDSFREALGPNGQLIVNLVPELKLIIGEQPPVPDLAPQDAQRRFQLVFRRFIDVFARPERPLALFLDDLQWLDPATLDLLEDLLTQPDVKHLMLIGCYRDNEVDSSHPLIRKLEAIRQSGAVLKEITLEPLTCEDLSELIVDSIHCETEEAAPLAQLIHEKAAGNPFFAIQFIYALAEEALLTFDHSVGRWSWDINRIHAKGYTDNVVDLMVGKLNRLPVETQKALQHLACLGNSADFALLATIYHDSKEKMQSDLEEAVQSGLVLRSERAYKFLHDRVQEAAYSLIPEGARASLHLRIGRLLASQTAPPGVEENIFEIVNQLNRGSDLLTSTQEHEHVGELNFIAGKRAKGSTAYGSALSYFASARALLGEQSWDRNYDLTFNVEFQTAECELLTANMAAAEDRLSIVARRARGAHHIAAVARLRLTLYTTLDRSNRGVEVCLEYLRQSGTSWSPHPTGDEVRHEYERIWSQLGTRPIEQLVELPLMVDPVPLDALDVLTEVVTPALFTDENLLSLVICRMVNLSLEYGNSDGSCFAYVWLGMIAGPLFQNYDAGFRFGRLGYDLVEKRGLNRYQARTFMSFGNLVMPWTKHIKTGRELVRRAFDAANRIGDLTFAAYSCNNLNTNLLGGGSPLADVQREAENGLDFAKSARFGIVVDIITAQLGLIRTLRGLTTKFGSFDGKEFDEVQFERHLASDTVLALPECWYWIRKLQARFFAQDYSSAIQASLNAERLLWTSPSFFEVAEYHFYGALTQATCCDDAPAGERQQHIDAVAAHHRQLQVWAENCPENFENRAALVGAEIARIEGRALNAMELYEQAIRTARANGFVHNEALANELAARFYAARGFEVIAEAYLRNARYGYLRWGANGKVRQLEEMNPQLREEMRAPGPTSTIATPVEQLDLATVIKVSQAVSSEIVLEKLIDTVMRTAIEQAGAERGLLILARGAEPRIEAEATTGGEAAVVHLRDVPVTAAVVPESVLYYVLRTRESVILDDAPTQPQFATDPYLRQHRARSILCLPLTNQAQLVGALYLENNLTTGAFTPTRIAVLKVIASQAAISLENTRLYRDLEQREAKIRRLVDANIIGIFIWELEGRILEANDAFLRMVGFDSEDVVSGRLRWTDLTPSEWLERDMQQNVPELRKKGFLQPFEKEFSRKDGSRVPVLIGTATFDEAGSQGVGFVVDLTERKHAERERERLRQLEADLAHTNRVSMMGELTASFAHEIKQPIAAAATNAKTSLRWLQREQPDIGEAREALSRIVKDVIRAADMIDRTRALYRRGAPKLEMVNLNESIREMVVLLHEKAIQHSILIRTELDGALRTITADPVQMQQVLMNLMLNGIEAMKDTGGELTIRSNNAGDGQILLAVSDLGIGLPVENAERIFDPFFTTKEQGTGMGLSICRRIIESHGGRLWASANTRPGATFQFTIPTEVRASSTSAGGDVHPLT
jgi:PAS domain S-box-containing protein